jgi:pre-mRNA-splicing factor SYF1
MQIQNAHNFDEIEGVLWCKLADYCIRLGELEVAQSIYEEAMDSVTHVHDFCLIFDVYSHFEEGTIMAHLALLEEEAQEDNMMKEDQTVEQQQSSKNEEGDKEAKELEMLLDRKGDTTSSDMYHPNEHQLLAGFHRNFPLAHDIIQSG